MLTVNKWDIHLTRGDTAYIKAIPEVEVLDENDNPTGVWELYTFQEGDRVIFRLANSSVTLIEKDCEIDLDKNVAVLTLTPEDTKTLEVRTYFYCLELVTAADRHFTFVENGKFTLGKELEKHGS